MRRTKEEAEITKQNILSAALVEFSRSGYQAARMEDIAGVANVTTGALYHHFGGKRELFMALLEQSEARANELASNIIQKGGSPLTLLKRLLVGLLVFIEQDREYRAVMELLLNKTGYSPELVEISEQIPTGRRQLVVYLSELIRQGVEEGEFRASVNPHVAALATAGYLYGMSLIWIQDPELFSIKERAEQLVDGFLSGIVASD